MALQTKEMMQAIASALDQTLNGGGPKKIGFVVLLFELNKLENTGTNYVSNCDRASILAALKEIVARFEGRTAA